MNPLTWLNPYKWLLYGGLLIALAVGAWRLEAHIEGIGYDRAQGEYTVKALAATQAARVREQALQSQVTKAQNDALIRQKSLQAAADTSRAQSDSLRAQLASNAAKLPGLTRAAIDDYASASGLVLAECTAAYSGVAKAADAAVSDVQTLQEAWPK